MLRVIPQAKQDHSRIGDLQGAAGGRLCIGAVRHMEDDQVEPFLLDQDRTQGPIMALEGTVLLEKSPFQ